MILFRKKNTISSKTYISNKISNKSKNLLYKDITSLKLEDISHLLREDLCVQVCINIAIYRLENVRIDFEFLFNNDVSEVQREILRELVLLNNRNWDLNSISFIKLKNIIGDNILALKLPELVNDSFLSYEVKRLKWNKKTINNFNSFMNDTRTGVLHAYGMIISLKRAVLNNVPIIFELNNENLLINTLSQFEDNILKSINPNKELELLLDKENW